jgi:hypothetical protein
MKPSLALLLDFFRERQKRVPLGVLLVLGALACSCGLGHNPDLPTLGDGDSGDGDLGDGDGDITIGDGDGDGDIGDGDGDVFGSGGADGSVTLIGAMGGDGMGGEGGAP